MMSRKQAAAIAAGLVVIVAVGVLSATRVFGLGQGPSLASQLNSPTYKACRLADKPICNPTAYATMVAGDPEAHPPSAHPHYISRSQAVAMALKSADPGFTPSDSTVHAQMMTLPRYEALADQGHDFLTNPHRLLWVVTVHAPITIQGHTKVITKNVYTVVIDAETGDQFQACYGCPVLG